MHDTEIGGATTGDTNHLKPCLDRHDSDHAEVGIARSSGRPRYVQQAAVGMEWIEGRGLNRIACRLG